MENKSLFLLGDFNKELSKYDIHTPTNKSLDSLFSNMILPYILHLKRVSGYSKSKTVASQHRTSRGLLLKVSLRS